MSGEELDNLAAELAVVAAVGADIALSRSQNGLHEGVQHEFAVVAAVFECQLVIASDPAHELEKELQLSSVRRREEKSEELEDFDRGRDAGLSEVMTSRGL